MLQDLMHALGYGLCHQLPERSFIAGGLQAPVCARDTGIYVGVLISLVVVAALHRGERPREFPPLRVWAILALLVAAMGWDGVTSYAGLRDSNNLLRLVTGLGTGYAVGVVLVPMLNDELWSRSGTGRVLGSLRGLAVWLVTLPLATAALWWGAPLLGAVYPLAVALCIVVTLALVNLVLVGMLPWFDRRAERLTQLLRPFVIAVFIAFAEIAFAGLLRLWLIGTFGA